MASVHAVMQQSFNGHGSENNLINTGKRLPGETIRNVKDKTVTAKESAQWSRNLEKIAASKRSKKIKMPPMPDWLK